MLVEVLITIRWFISRKFAKATNAHLVNSSEEESFQFILNMSSVVSGERSAAGRLFHTAGPLTRKLRSP